MTSDHQRGYHPALKFKGKAYMKLWSNNNVPRNSGSLNPERRLLAAVLQRAITDFLTGDGELRESAREWIFGPDDHTETFGFAFICEALDFHREELRKAIQRQSQNASFPKAPVADEAVFA